MAFMSILIADIETDGFNPSVIWVLGVLDWETDEYTSYTGDDIPEGLMRLVEADLVVGHNFVGFDAVQIEKLTGGLVKIETDNIYDTLLEARKLIKMKNHKLSEWGEIFGFPKGDHKDFSRLSPEMLVYCERDVRLTRKVFDFLLEIESAKNKTLV